LINNAGILRDGLLLKVKDGVMTKMSLAQWQAVIDVNLTGVFLCTREVAAKMVELNSQGAIINISSISRAGNVGQTNYSAAKAGVAAATVTWAKELARYGIRVGGYCAGLYRDRDDPGHEARSPGKDDFAGIPLKRMGKARKKSPIRRRTSSRTTTTPGASWSSMAGCGSRPPARETKSTDGL
jgi:3-oxoacyl-[acyl-carrier protein] reductase